MSAATVCHEEFLGYLSIDRGRSRTDLARELYVSPSTAGRYLNDLVVRGWAERQVWAWAESGATRGIRYRLTPAGEAAYNDRESF